MSNEIRRRGERGKNLTRLQAQAIEWAKSNGMLPHEILLDMARGNPQKVRKVTGVDEETGLLITQDEWVSVTVEDQRDAAKAAAPYYAPKLSTVETVQGISDGDLDQLIKQLADQAGIGTALGGEGQEGEEEEGDSGSGGARSTQRRRIDLD